MNREIGIDMCTLEDPLEKEMTPHSGILAWRISWTEEPSRLQSMGAWHAAVHGVAMCQTRRKQSNMQHAHD